MCDHCGSKLLEPMIHAETPEKLVEACQRLEERGDAGCLVTGGSRRDGTLPWEDFIPAIKTAKETTGLHISIHGGVINHDLARSMKDAGVDQVLLDVVGDDETLASVLHAGFSVERINNTLAALTDVGIPVVPHIVVGLNYGKIKGEYEAVRMIKGYRPEAMVIVSLMPLAGTPMSGVPPPEPQDIARIIAAARIEMPDVPISLGCARDSSDPGIDVLAVDCGVNRMAIPSEEAIKRAEYYGLEMIWQGTCCSVPLDIEVAKDGG